MTLKKLHWHLMPEGIYWRNYTMDKLEQTQNKNYKDLYGVTGA